MSPQPAAMAEILGTMKPSAILDLLRTAGHDSHVAALEPLIQPAHLIVATQLAPRAMGFRREEGSDPVDPEKLAALEDALAKLPLGASRFGGVPDLPPGVAWPDREGVPMEFIAQIRLADVSTDPRLPSRGSLAFFWNSQWGASDMEHDAACCAVVFHEGADEALVRATPPRVEWKSEFADVTQIAPMIHGLASLRFEPTWSVPGGVSPFVTGALAEIWQDFHSEHHASLGAAQQPYHGNYLLGYVDEQDYVDAHANGVNDQLLLQVDSEDAAEFQFGDCNKLFFLLTKDELAARDFSRVRVYSQLG